MTKKPKALQRDRMRKSDGESIQDLIDFVMKPHTKTEVMEYFY